MLLFCLIGLLLTLGILARYVCLCMKEMLHMQRNCFVIRCFLQIALLLHITCQIALLVDVVV